MKRETVDVKGNFAASDFVVFSAILGISAIVGIYYGYKDRKQKSTANYYFGGKKMNPIAVGMSLAVTFISAITIIAIPTEAYIIGTVQLWYCLCPLASALFVAIYMVPMLYRLNVQSVYEYLELRYNRTVRRIFATVQSLNMCVYLGLIIFLPSIALNAVTPIPVHWSIALTAILCTFYTTLGGMKAVIWTDVIQTGVIVIGCLAVLIQAIVSIGGFDELSSALERGQRRNAFDPDFDITSRKSPIAVFVGWFTTSVGTMSFAQPIMQRIISCKSARYAQCAILSSSVPSVLVALISAVNGLAMYAYYEGCDPVKSGQLQKMDQGLPFMALAVFKNFPGIAGLFISAIYSATLSSVSSILNSSSIIILEDFLLQKWPNTTDEKKLFAGKVIAVLLGVIGMTMAYVISFVKANTIQIIFSTLGLINGPYIGICFLGVFIPWATTLGGMIGAGFAYAFLIFLVIGALFSRNDAPRVLLPPVDTSLCTLNATTFPFNATIEWSNYTTAATAATATENVEYSTGQVLYHINFLYYNVLSNIITLVIGLIASFLTGARNPSESDPKLFIPLLDNPLFPEKVRRFFRFGVPELGEWNKETVPDPDHETEMEKFELKNGIDNNDDV